MKIFQRKKDFLYGSLAGVLFGIFGTLGLSSLVFPVYSIQIKRDYNREIKDPRHEELGIYSDRPHVMKISRPGTNNLLIEDLHDIAHRLDDHAILFRDNSKLTETYIPLYLHLLKMKNSQEYREEKKKIRDIADKYFK